MASRLRVRMYKQGLGDCFLLTFDGTAHVLIDCGTIGATAPHSFGMDPIVGDILASVGQQGETRGKLAAVVATHEHMDHISGFKTHFDKLKQLDVAESWQAWTEDESNPQARKLEKYKGDLVKATALAAEKLQKVQQNDSGLRAIGAATDDVLEFNDLALKKSANDGMSNALALGRSRVFLSPGMVFTRPWAPKVRFYVLGPPTDPNALHNMGRPGSPDLYDFAAAVDPGSPDSGSRLPFDDILLRDESDPQVRAACGLSYDDPSQAWRRIDADWLGVAADFALQLDNYTNNTSLVLAVEIDGKVLLFPGDAQLGSWMSWKSLSFSVNGSTVNAPDLLKRTVFYKVGHHSSHNATPKANGLELMESNELTAFIPLDGAVAKKKKWKMPAAHLYERLLEKAQGRVVRSDLGLPAADARPSSISAWA